MLTVYGENVTSKTPHGHENTLKMLDVIFLDKCGHASVCIYHLSGFLSLICWLPFSRKKYAQKLLLQRNNANRLSDLPAVTLICHESFWSHAQKCGFVRLITHAILHRERRAQNCLLIYVNFSEWFSQWVTSRASVLRMWFLCLI